MEPAATEAQPAAGTSTGAPNADPAEETSGPSAGAFADAGPWALAGGSGDEGPEELPAPGSQAEALALSSPLLLPYERLMLEEVLQVGGKGGPLGAQGGARVGLGGLEGADMGHRAGEKPRRARPAVGAL